MNKLNIEKQVQTLQALVEGNSIRSTSRMTGVAQGTILSLLQRVGDACQRYHEMNVMGLTCRRVQCDEIWNYCRMKEKNVPAEHKGEVGYGDVYTWTAIDAESKFMISYLVGKREESFARAFISDLKNRLVNRPQITSDGLNFYPMAIDEIFKDDVDYAIIKKYLRSRIPCR